MKTTNLGGQTDRQGEGKCNSGGTGGILNGRDQWLDPFFLLLYCHCVLLGRFKVRWHFITFVIRYDGGCEWGIMWIPARAYAQSEGGGQCLSNIAFKMGNYNWNISSFITRVIVTVLITLCTTYSEWVMAWFWQYALCCDNMLLYWKMGGGFISWRTSQNVINIKVICVRIYHFYWG